TRHHLNAHAAQCRHVHLALAINLPKIFGLEYRLQPLLLFSPPSVKPKNSMRLYRSCLASPRNGGALAHETATRTQAHPPDPSGSRSTPDTPLLRAPLPPQSPTRSPATFPASRSSAPEKSSTESPASRTRAQFPLRRPSRTKARSRSAQSPRCTPSTRPATSARRSLSSSRSPSYTSKGKSPGTRSPPPARSSRL